MSKQMNKTSNGNKPNKGGSKSNRNSGGNRHNSSSPNGFGEGSRKNVDYDNIRSNDISWYNKSVVYKDATRVPFNRIIGDPVELSGIMPLLDGIQGTSSEYSALAPTPGVMRIQYAPTIGISKDVNSQVNRCFTSIYGDIYSKTTGAMQFQQADLAMLSLGLASIISNIASVKRALGISLLFSNENYYYPKTIMKAIGFMPETLIGRQDEIRMRLNEAISNVNHLKMPAFIDLFKRAYQLPLNIYADEDDIKSQLYAFVPEGYYVYRDMPDRLSDYSHLEYKEFTWETTERTMSIDTMLDIIYEQLEAWRQSSDLGIISGSIQRAYSDNQLLKLDWTGSDYLTIPTYDKTMNWQINNAVLTRGVNPDSMHVLQDPVSNAILHQPQLDLTGFAVAPMRDNFLINSYDGSTDETFIMESTRLIVHSTGDSVKNQTIDICGLEIPTIAIIYSLSRDSEGNLKDAGHQVHTTQLLSFSMMSSPTMLSGVLETLSIASKFKNAPRLELVLVRDDTTPNEYTWLGQYGDLYRYTTVDTDALRALMIAAYQSIYVPNERTHIQ